MRIEIVDAETVRRVLTMPACIDVLDRAMRAVSRQEVSAPPRLFSAVSGTNASLGLMPGSTAGLPMYGAKIISLHPDNPARGLPTIQGFVALFDRDSGTPVALIDGAEVTAIRTAAASGLATRALARPNAKSHGVFGTGVQACAHIEAIAAVRPIERVVIWGRDPGRARALAGEQAARTGLRVEATGDPTGAAACDVVSTVTAAREPILMGDWLKPGTHVNLVGGHEASAREADSALIANARVFVDRLESAMNEAGDLLIPITEGRIDRHHVVGELGQVLDGRVAGRVGVDDVTVYKSLGFVAQDLFAAEYVVANLPGA